MWHLCHSDALMKENSKEPNMVEVHVDLVSVNSLVQSPFQFRSAYSERKIDDLKASIEEVGLLQPLIVRENDIGALEIIAGHRRFKALQKAGLEKVLVIKRKMTDEEAIFTQLAENIQREDASDYDIGQALHKLNRKQSQEELGKKIGISQQQVSRYIEHYLFCEDTITPAGVMLDAGGLAERQTRPLRQLNKTDKIKEAIKTLDIKPKTKITRQHLGQVRLKLAKEVEGYQNEEVKKFLVDHHYLTSLVSYKNRGSFGNPYFPGNASGFLLVQLINFFKPKIVFDPMEGGRTSQDVCEAIGIDYIGNDLQNQDGYDLVTVSLEKLPNSDLTYFHPPYWNLIKYTNDPNDLSNAKTWDEFEDKLAICIQKLLQKTKILAVLVGDIPKDNKYFSPLSTILKFTKRLAHIIIKERFTVLGIKGFYDATEEGRIPTQHEYCVLLKGDLA